jgi:hypothetical protein
MKTLTTKDLALAIVLSAVPLGLFGYAAAQDKTSSASSEISTSSEMSCPTASDLAPGQQKEAGTNASSLAPGKQKEAGTNASSLAPGRLAQDCLSSSSEEISSSSSQISSMSESSASTSASSGG